MLLPSRTCLSYVNIPATNKKVWLHLKCLCHILRRSRSRKTFQRLCKRNYHVIIFWGLAMDGSTANKDARAHIDILTVNWCKHVYMIYIQLIKSHEGWRPYILLFWCWRPQLVSALTSVNKWYGLASELMETWKLPSPGCHGRLPDNLNLIRSMHRGAQIRFHGKEELTALTDGKQAHDQDSSPGDTTHFNNRAQVAQNAKFTELHYFYFLLLQFLVYTPTTLSCRKVDQSWLWFSVVVESQFSSLSVNKQR